MIEYKKFLEIEKNSENNLLNVFQFSEALDIIKIKENSWLKKNKYFLLGLNGKNIWRINLPEKIIYSKNIFY